MPRLPVPRWDRRLPQGTDHHGFEFAAADRGEFTGALLALWWDGQGDWQKAHEIAQDVSGADGAWVHAYLHRKEGDAGTPLIGIGMLGNRWLRVIWNWSGSGLWGRCLRGGSLV